MKRQMIKIDEEKCNGCGLCVDACNEGALALVDGKAKLIREDYCDGLGNCLPACPQDAISFETRDAPAFIENPGQDIPLKPVFKPGIISFNDGSPRGGELSQWPVQIKLAPVDAPWFNGSHLLIAGDCTAFAMKDFHEKFIKGRVTLVGCPKLDSTDYSDKLAEIFKGNDIKSITLVRMEVPCCGGMTVAVKNALVKSGKDIPLTIHVISRTGMIISSE